MIFRTYFVAYAGPGGLTGSLTSTSKSWLPMPDKVFINALDFLKENHPDCVITVFHRI